ncbi:Uncharacterized protein FKW44_021797, partial [Caligus rogercresseyi]
IKFVHDSIYNTPKLNLGQFDFIDCVEVFHQLSEPGLALKILKDSLKDESSGMYISLHGREGRKGVNLMRKIIDFVVQENDKALILREELELGALLYESLPEHHWVYYPKITRVPLPDNSTFIHKYLHKHENSYTINEAYAFIQEEGGLHLIDFADPETGLTLEQRRDIHERIYSAVSEINIFVSGNPKASVDLSNFGDFIPYFHNIDPNPILKKLSSQDCRPNKQYLNVSLALKSGSWRNVIHPVSLNTRLFYELMSLQRLSVNDILSKTLKVHSGQDRAALNEELKSLCEVLLRHGLIVFRHVSVQEDSALIRTRPSGIIERVQMINFELSIFASTWPKWALTDRVMWPKM